jgi:transcriptional regulator GlxA family with amidase domain
VVCPRGAYLSSIGTIADGIARVDGQARTMYVPPYRLATESQVHFLSTADGTITLAGGRSVTIDGDMQMPESFQMIYVAAFEAPDEDSLMACLAREKKLVEWLTAQQATQAVIGAADSAIFLLAEAGLLDKGQAAIPRNLSALFRRRYPRIHADTRATVVEHKGIFTAGTVANEWLLVARLVESGMSSMMSRWLAGTTGLQRIRDNTLLAADPLVAAAQFWLGERFARSFRISDMARDLAVSHPTLIRHFVRSLSMTPRQYVRMLRVEAAKDMLITTNRPIDQISMMLGYADTRTFRDVFRKHAGMAPTLYRTSAGR